MHNDEHITKAQLMAAFEVARAVGVMIRQRQEIPSGELYAMLCGKISLNDYNHFIGLLKRTGLVTETPAHLLRWNQPEGQAPYSSAGRSPEPNAP